MIYRPFELVKIYFSSVALVVVALVVLLPTAKASTSQEKSTALPSTGQEISAMECVDRVMVDFMKKWEIPGGAIAVSDKGRLVYARGFGWADQEAKQPVEPDALFRIASVSKPLTSVMLLTLLDQGKVDLDDPVMKYLEEDYQPFDGLAVDPQVKKITLRQLLQHTGGFNRNASFDPMFQPKELVNRLGRPPEAGEIIRFMLSRPLDFTPGERYAYSNFGYCLLGRVIEKVTGKTYEAAVQEKVLLPVGAKRTRIGKTHLDGRVEDEVVYYPTRKGAMCKSIFGNPDSNKEGTAPYCSFYLEPMDSHGAWISSTVDLLRFVNSVDGRRKPALLKPETVKLMLSDTLQKPDGTRTDYALGWSVRGEGNCVMWCHDGSLPGTATMLLTTGEGQSCAVLLNRRKNEKHFFGDLSNSVINALHEVKNWPEKDQFGEFR